jgi:HSP20 family protein
MLPVLRTTWPSLVGEFLGNNYFLSEFLNERTAINAPAVNIIEGKDDYRIEVAAPGLEKKDFVINLNNNVLTISSEKENTKEETEGKVMFREFSFSSFKRSFTLPNTVDADKIVASHKEGILYITIPKREEAKVKPARQIAVA